MELVLEEELIARSLQGESHAFKQLIGTYRRQLFGYLLKFCGDRMLAEDLMQETLIRVWKNLPGYTPQNRFSSWLFCIAHNVAVDSGRKQKIREMVVHTGELETRNDYDPHSEMVYSELKDIVDSVLCQMPEKQKNVFLLREHGGLTFKEISELTGEPLNTVLGHMHYAVEKLRKALRQKDVI